MLISGVSPKELCPYIRSEKKYQELDEANIIFTV
jgi:hypothetical protein